MATQQDPWAEFRTEPAQATPQQPAPQQAQPRPPGIIRGPERQAPPPNPVAVASENRQMEQHRFRVMTPEEAQSNGLNPGVTYQINGLGEIKPVGGQAPARTPAENPDRVPQLESIIGLIGQLRDEADDTLAVGRMSRSVSEAPLIGPLMGQNRANVEGYLQTIEGDLIQQQLARLSQLNPQGVASLANSETEARRMAASIANLDPNQEYDQFISGVQRAEDYYQREYERLTGRRYGEPAASMTGRENPDAPVATQPLGAMAREGGTPLVVNGSGNGGPSGTDPDPDGGTDERGTPLRLMDGQILLEYIPGPSGETVPIYGPDPEVEAEAAKVSAIQGDPGLRQMSLQGATLGLSDESAGVGTAIAQAMLGNFDVAENYRLGRDADRLRTQQARDATGVMGTATEIVSGGASIAARAGSLMRAGRAAAANTGSVTRPAVQREMVRSATREGGAVGALGGFGYGEGTRGSVENALVGGTLGGALGNVAQRAGNALANRVPAQNAARDTMDAATELGIDVIPAMTGGTMTRRLTAGARQGYLSDVPIAPAIERMQGQAGNARNEVARSVGNPTSADEAGEIVRRAANVYSQQTGATGGRLYDRAANLSRGVKVKLPGAIQTADRLIAEASQAPGGAANAKAMIALRENMDGGAFTPSGIRQMRTALREQMQERGLRGSNTDRQLGQIVDAAEQDMIGGLRQAGREQAAEAYQTASRFWRERVEAIDQVLEPVLGKSAPRSGEQVLAGLERLARPDSGNAPRLRRLFQAMPDDEANSVRATIISRLGRPTKGAGEVLDENSFSLERFLTNWNDMTPQARRQMFPGESIDALNRLATVASAAKRAGSVMNASNTAGALASQGVISGGLFWALEPLTAVSITASQYGAGRLLASRRFARWLAGAPRASNPRAREAYIARLGDIARAEPAIAGDLVAFERSLTGANDNAVVVNNVAAEGQDEKRR